MSKTKDELLLDYRKSNKVRRAKIVEKSGCTDEAAYIAFLLMEPEATSGSPAAAALFKHNQPVEETPTIHNVHIIDISGSMSGGKIRSAIQGVNEEVVMLQKDDTVIYTHSLIEFSSWNDIKTIAHKLPIKNVGLYSTSTRGMTALNQALGETLQKFRDGTPVGEKVLVKIFTDGGENDSRGKWADNKTLKEFIAECEANGFTVTFIGTDHDVAHVIQHLNIDASNTYAHDNTEKGVYMASMERGSATLSYSKRVKAKEDVSKGFYKDIKNP